MDIFKVGRLVSLFAFSLLVAGGPLFLIRLSLLKPVAPERPLQKGRGTPTPTLKSTAQKVTHTSAT